MSLHETVRVAADDVRSLDRPFALVGGLAVSARAEVRFTRDADLAVAVVDDRQAEAVVYELTALGYELAASIEHEGTGRLAAVRLRSRVDAGAMVDLLFASSGIEAEIAAAADEIALSERLSIPVATVGHLMALKLLAADDRTRPHDLSDARGLARVADGADWAEADSACRLIIERGYARGRDLVAAIERLRADPD